MNVLQAHKYYWPRDGASKYMLQISELLEQHGDTVIPFSTWQPEHTKDSLYQPYFVEYIDLHTPNTLTWQKKMTAMLRMFYSHQARSNISQLLDAYPVDIAHIHNIYHHISPSILPELKKRKVPIVMTLHDYKLLAPNYTLFHHGAVHEENAKGWYLSNIWQTSMHDSFIQSSIVTAEMIFHHKLMKYYERYVDHFISPSQFLIDTCVRHGWDAHKFTHIPNPVELKEQISISEKKGYVAYLGRLSKEKGVDILIDAAAKTPNITFKIAGDGPLRSELQEKISKMQLSNVGLVGFLRGDSLKKFTQEASIICVPSIWYENNPLTILEACASGTVVIGSDIGGIPEMLPKELLFEANNSMALAEKITYIDGLSRGGYKKIADKLQDRVANVNAPQTHLASLSSVYSKLLDI